MQKKDRNKERKKERNCEFIFVFISTEALRVKIQFYNKKGKKNNVIAGKPRK